MNLNALYRKARSIRRFTKEPVSDEALKAILENCRIASCGRNAQTLTYVVVKSPEKVSAMHHLVKWAAALPDGKGTPADDQYPPLYLVIIQHQKGGLTDIDAGIAANTIMTSATDLGLASCIFASHNPAKVSELLALKEEENPRLVIALGHPACESTIVDMQDNNINYTMDDHAHFYVPKRALKDIVEIK